MVAAMASKRRPDSAGTNIAEGLSAFQSQKERQQQWLAKDQELLQVLVDSARQLVQEAMDEAADPSRIKSLQATIDSCDVCLDGVREAWKDLDEKIRSFDDYDVLYAALSDGLAEKHLMLYSEMLNVKGAHAEPEGPASRKGTKSPGLPTVGQAAYRPSLSIAAAKAGATGAATAQARSAAFPLRSQDPEEFRCSCEASGSPSQQCRCENGNGGRPGRREFTITEYEVVKKSLPWRCSLHEPCLGGGVCRERRLIRKATTTVDSGRRTTEAEDEVAEWANCDLTCAPPKRSFLSDAIHALRCCQVTDEISVGI